MATSEIYTLSLHDALPICGDASSVPPAAQGGHHHLRDRRRSEEHTSELQSRGHLVFRLLLEKKYGLARCFLFLPRFILTLHFVFLRSVEEPVMFLLGPLGV